MNDNILHDRGRGPEIVGTRITVYHLVPYFLDPSATEAYICQVNRLTPEQVAAARAYVLSHADTVLAEHLEIEARNAAGSGSVSNEQTRRIRETFNEFRNWFAERGSNDRPTTDAKSGSVANSLPTFRDWIAAREAPVGERP
jgi:uncharacterized protein (DUF433 family)